MNRLGNGSAQFSPPEPNGFTLIEVLVAMVVLSVSLVTIFQLFSGGLAARRRAEEVGRATFHAREKMEELLLRPEMTPGALEGTWEDGYSWQAEIKEVFQGDPEEAPAWRQYFSLFDIALEVQKGASGPSVELHCRHLARLIEAKE
ncbi:MAG: prepilin-type N-terminal cleavage/methylation domain-containing protein [Desulfococcaceae bacterium]